ncbi:MAG: putative zinc-binding protein [Spirochaetales bacterium]|uniref:Zinc-binding protein n=1 Tax=Candidatus Thalassospirochaeta sargassi TaxID=3119039 RepID=A0AAJ1IGU2_9SPIO|nr:putative zinc-binding protein [Spirochaetales bacterium]
MTRKLNCYIHVQVFRKLHAAGVAYRTCLAGVGADLSGFTISAQEAKENIIIDGCKISCRKKIFEKNNLPYTHFITTDFDVKKRKTEITDKVIDRVTEEIRMQIEG